MINCNSEFRAYALIRQTIDNQSVENDSTGNITLKLKTAWFGVFPSLYLCVLAWLGVFH